MGLRVYEPGRQVMVYSGRLPIFPIRAYGPVRLHSTVLDMVPRALPASAGMSAGQASHPDRAPHRQCVLLTLPHHGQPPSLVGRVGRRVARPRLLPVCELRVVWEL